MTFRMVLFDSSTRHLVLFISLMNCNLISCDRTVNWYFGTRDYSRQCYCSLYSNSCRPNGCAKTGPCRTPYPQNYIAYHLNGDSITIDGKLDDPAWKEVEWSNPFQDIRGDNFPPPRYETKFKLRWDDEYLYVALLMSARDLWGTFTKDESHVFKENAVDFIFAPDETLQNYKEIQGSVQNVTFDLMMSKAYMDGGFADQLWDANEKKGVTHDGIINDPNKKGTYWTTEWALPFRHLAKRSKRNQSRPSDNEVLFMQIGRPDYKVKVIRDEYEKDTSEPAEWYAWEPTGAVNLHIPSRWGLVQYARDKNVKKFDFPRWHIYKTLFAIFDAMVQFKAMNGIYTADLKELPLPRYVYRRKCIRLPRISLTGGGFEVRVRSRRTKNDGGRSINEEGRILQDRSVSITQY